MKTLEEIARDAAHECSAEAFAIYQLPGKNTFPQFEAIILAALREAQPQTKETATVAVPE